jgi:hypothetical protein
MRPSALWIVVLSCGSLVGCRGEKAGGRVFGALVKDGKPLVLPEDEEIDMKLVSVDPEASLTEASVVFDRAAGTFRVQGPTQERIPPGEYKIVIIWKTSDDEVPDRFDGDLDDENTPLRCTVERKGEHELVIDVKEKTVTEK